MSVNKPKRWTTFQIVDEKWVPAEPDYIDKTEWYIADEADKVISQLKDDLSMSQEYNQILRQQLDEADEVIAKLKSQPIQEIDKTWQLYDMEKRYSDRLRKALEFYADERNYVKQYPDEQETVIEDDKGYRATECLKETGNGDLERD